jgi:uncharacterized membrane protein YbhN (UPF0104 family)
LSDDPGAKGRGLKRLLFALAGVALSALGLAYVYGQSDPEKLLAAVADVRLLPLLGTIAAYWIGVVSVRAWLVRRLLFKVGAVRVPAAYRYICIGFLANNVLPLRAGDMARSVAIQRGAGLSLPSVIGGLALERMLDMGMVAAVALVALQLAPLPPMIKNAALATAIAVGVGLVVVVFLSRRGWREADAAATGRLRALVWNLWVRFSAGLGAMSGARSIAAALGLIAAVWALTLVTMALRLEAFGVAVTPSLVFTLVTCLGFGVAVPSAPGYVGVYHASAAFALVVNKVDPAIAASFAMFSWVLDVGIGSVLGAVSLSIEGLRLGDLRKRAPAAGD